MTSSEDRSVHQLVSAATDWSLEDGNGDWTAVTQLHHLGSREVLDHAMSLVGSADPRERARGADILGQLGVPTRTFPEECLQVVLALAVEENDPVVLQAAAVALGHLRDPRGTSALVRIAGNVTPDVRQAVAFALGGRAEPEAVAALVSLSRDTESEVRDWATFGLGEMGQVDSPEVRSALLDRLDDADADTRFEALCGLARLGDLRVGPFLLKALREDPEDTALWQPAMTFLKIDAEAEPSVDVLIDGIERIVAC